MISPLGFQHLYSFKLLGSCIVYQWNCYMISSLLWLAYALPIICDTPFYSFLSRVVNPVVHRDRILPQRCT
jgi:hypothetical protein